MIDISVIIPSYNRVGSIERAINSVLSQDFRGSYEIIVSDDGSTDGTIELVEGKYKESVILVRKPDGCKDQGAAGARNRGIDVSKGNYVCFLDSDDAYEPIFLTRCYEALSNDEKLGYVFCRVNKCTRATDNSIDVKPWTRASLSYVDRKYHVLHRAYCICTISIMCRRSVLDLVGAFDTTLMNGQDSDMWIRISEVSKGRFLDFVGATYYIEGFVNNQLTKSSTKEFKRGLSQRIYAKALERYKESHCKDGLRLLIIKMNIMSFEESCIGNPKLRRLIILFRLFFRQPISVLQYIFGAIA